MNTPYSAFEQGSAGEVRINQVQMAAIQHLYNTSPSLQAARAILVGQLLSSGLSLTRNGEAVKLKPTFPAPRVAMASFARNVTDQILMFGFCVVSSRKTTPPFATFVAQRSGAPTQAGAYHSEHWRSTGQTGSRGGRGRLQGAGARAKGSNLVPVVPVLARTRWR